jgi:pyruvate formate lyase activating enzyme
MLKEALLYKKAENNGVDCFLCSHYCKIAEGNYGICGVRQNIKGVLYSHVYGEVIALNIDPIEKKPIFHVFPGSKSYSLATVGCNFRCDFCQNWQISQKKEAERLRTEIRDFTPEEIVEQAVKNRCKSISYTYTEPTVFFEFAYDVARLAKRAGLYNIFVTNGYMTKDAIGIIKPYLDAANIDLKFFNDDSYRRVCGARLEPVLDTIRYMHEQKIWIEVTTLIVPSQNDSLKELRGIADFLAGVGKEIPWHISRFHPDYKMDKIPHTPVKVLKEAYKEGKNSGLRYVYIGNAWEEEKTCCYNCGEILISRQGFDIVKYNLNDSMCPECGMLIDGVKI